MFLRRNRRTVEGETYDYWTLVKTVRTARGPRQQIVATLGKEPGLESAAHRGWEEVAELLEGRAPTPVQGRLGEALEAPPRPQWAQVDLAGVRVERVRDFGQIYLALSLWRRLGLHTLLREIIEPGQEEVPWELTACVLTLARFCGQKSELEVAERWYADSALEDLLGVPFSRINDARLYRGLDVLHAHKDALCAHLHERYQSWFGVEFEFLLYEVTSTYFEGQALRNEKAARGYSRDQRPDCQQVNIGPARPPAGLPSPFLLLGGHTRRSADRLRNLRRQHRRRDHRRRDGHFDGKQIRPGQTHLGDGSRDDQRGKPRVFARPRRALSGRHAQEPAQEVRGATARGEGLGASAGRHRSQTRGPSRRRPRRAISPLPFERPAGKRSRDDRAPAPAAARPAR